MQLHDLSNKISPTLCTASFCNQKLEQDFKPKEAKPSIMSISNALFIILYVICAMQIMPAAQRNTFFNVLLNTKIQQSASIFMKHMVRKF